MNSGNHEQDVKEFASEVVQSCKWLLYSAGRIGVNPQVVHDAFLMLSQAPPPQAEEGGTDDDTTGNQVPG